MMGFPQHATIIAEDNQACVYASEIPHMTRGMRHLDLAELLIKEKVDAKEIKLLKVASADNTSDLGTKRLALPFFNKLTKRIIVKTLRVNLKVLEFTDNNISFHKNIWNFYTYTVLMSRMFCT